MVIYLRDNNNNSLFEASIWVSNDGTRKFVELSANVYIDAYSRFLLKNQERQHEIINTFDNLSELRGWMWENYFMAKKNDGSEVDEIRKEVMGMFEVIAKRLKNQNIKKHGRRKIN